MDDEYNRRLATEAVIVGTALLPLYVLTKSVLSSILPRLADKTREYMSVVFSGSLFHVICEGTGINDWYLDNGVAVMKRMEKEKVDWTSTLNDPALCDGACGWREGGLCSHYSFHAS